MVYALNRFLNIFIVETFHKIIFGTIYKLYELGVKEISLLSMEDFLIGRPKSEAIFKQYKGEVQNIKIQAYNNLNAEVEALAQNILRRVRNEKNIMMFKIQSAFVEGMREYLYKNEFTEIHTPKLIGAASESGSDEFEVKIIDNEVVEKVFDVVKKKGNVTKFVVEEPSLNEIFVSKVGKEYDK